MFSQIIFQDPRHTHTHTHTPARCFINHLHINTEYFLSDLFQRSNIQLTTREFYVVKVMKIYTRKFATSICFNERLFHNVPGEFKCTENSQRKGDLRETNSVII